MLQNWKPKKELFRDLTEEPSRLIAKSMLDCWRVENIHIHVKKYIIRYDIKGKMLQIGASYENMIQTGKFFELECWNLDIDDDKHPNTIIADITNCPQIKDNSFDFIYSIDTFEHIKEPWKASKEIIRILKPNGLICIIAPFSWRYHCSPIDYWRFTPQCLMFLFKDLKCLEANWDIKNRRVPYQGTTKEAPYYDICPEDHFGPWLENWRSYFIGIKEE